MPFLEFVRKYDISDAKQVGEDTIFISPAEYWKMANRMSERFIRRSDDEAKTINGFLTDLEGYHLCLGSEIAGTGITVSDYPAIDLALLQTDGPHAQQMNQSILDAVSRMRRNLAGYVVRNYSIDSDMMEWVFGALVFARLRQPGTMAHWPDDPMNERVEDIPLAEFLDYLRDWYHPRYKKMREAQ